jgi:GNAT superfamily N-acetyltransferase
MTFFDLVLHSRASLHPDGEPDRFVVETTGYVVAEGEDGVPRRVGKVHAWRVQAALAAAAGESLFDVCDAHSQELHEVHALLYEPDGYEFSGAIVSRFDAFEPDCLVLDYVVLHPKWRGLRLGLLAVRKLVDLLGCGCGLAVSHVAPLRADAHDILRVPPSWLPANGTAARQRAATRKLRRYYRQMGFRRVGRSPYYALSLARQAPTLADLLKPAGERRA